MSDQLSMFDPTTSGDIRSATGLPGSGDGPMRSDSPDGPMLDLFGQAHVPASRFQRQEKTQVERTSGTYGRIGSVSSASAGLASSLARMLMRRLDGAGSTLFSETWRRKVTPRGRQYWEHTASGRRTSGSDCGSWVSPTACSPNSLQGQRQDPEKRKAAGHAVNLQDQVTLAPWPTPMAGTNRKSARAMARSVNNGRRTGGGQSSPPGLEQQAEMVLASWPTPISTNGKDKTSPTVGGMELNQVAQLASWPTPQTADVNLSCGSEEYQRRKLETSPYPNLALTAKLAPWQLAAWPTPDTEAGRPASLELIERRKQEGKKTTVRLSAMAAWATPRANKWGEPDSHGKCLAPLQRRKSAAS